MTQKNNNIYQKRILRIDLGISACYLIEMNGWFIQVDSGYERCFETYLKALRKHKISPTDIRFLFLTHHHDDHSGMLNRITSIIPDLRIIAHRKSELGLNQGRNLYKTSAVCPNGFSVFCLKFYKIFNRKWTNQFTPFRFRQSDILFDDMDYDIRLDDFGIINGVASFSKGHSEDHLSLVFPDSKVFAGDAAVNMLKWARTYNTEAYIEDLNAYYETWKQWDQIYNIKTIYPSHGKPFSIDLLIKNSWKITKPERFPIVTDWMK